MDNISAASIPFLQTFLQFLPRLIASLVIFLVTLYLSAVAARAVGRALKLRDTDQEISLLLVRSAKLAIVITGTIIALQQVGFDLTAFVAGLGIIGFTLGFALQDVSKNLIAGVLLLLQQPFDIGDTVEAGGFAGIITNINLRATEMQTFDGILVMIPNTVVYSKPVKNFNRVEQRCLELPISIAYGSGVQIVEQTVQEALISVPGVIAKDPAPRVVFQKFGEKSIELIAYYWIKVNAAGEWGTADEPAQTVQLALERAGIESHTYSADADPEAAGA
jgi:small-conductance mechanosensitive channel